jgi:hypothetical protein
MSINQEKRAESDLLLEIDYLESLEVYLDEGWAPTRCPQGCIVETDGICPHNFKSVLLEYGII